MLIKSNAIDDHLTRYEDRSNAYQSVLANPLTKHSFSKEAYIPSLVALVILKDRLASSYALSTEEGTEYLKKDEYVNFLFEESHTSDEHQVFRALKRF